MRDSEIFAARAEAAGVEGREATLENVKERCRRAEQAWSVMAERSRLMEAAREARANSVERV